MNSGEIANWTTRLAEGGSAKSRVYYAAAGIDKITSQAIIDAMAEHEDLDVFVVADCSAHARRLGYGAIYHELLVTPAQIVTVSAGSN